MTIPNKNVVSYSISWDPPSCDVDSYTLYFTTRAVVHCQNKTLGRDATAYDPNGLKEIQIAAHLHNMTNCSKGILSCNNHFDSLYLTLEVHPRHQVQ